MNIRLLNPITASFRHKIHADKASRPILTYEERIKSDRIATGAIMILILITGVVYNFLY